MIELVLVRDPDGGVDSTLFIDGVRIDEADITHHVVDAGAGYDWETWKEDRDHRLRTASPGARELLLEAFTDPPGGKYIDNVPRADDGWGRDYLADLPPEFADTDDDTTDSEGETHD